MMATSWCEAIAVDGGSMLPSNRGTWLQSFAKIAAAARRRWEWRKDGGSSRNDQSIARRVVRVAEAHGQTAANRSARGRAPPRYVPTQSARGSKNHGTRRDRKSAAAASERQAQNRNGTATWATEQASETGGRQLPRTWRAPLIKSPIVELWRGNTYVAAATS